jgi:hypothetical protein
MRIKLNIEMNEEQVKEMMDCVYKEKKKSTSKKELTLAVHRALKYMFELQDKDNK